MQCFWYGSVSSRGGGGDALGRGSPQWWECNESAGHAQRCGGGSGSRARVAVVVGDEAMPRGRQLDHDDQYNIVSEHGGEGRDFSIIFIILFRSIGHDYNEYNIYNT